MVRENGGLTAAEYAAGVLGNYETALTQTSTFGDVALADVLVDAISRLDLERMQALAARETQANVKTVESDPSKETNNTNDEKPPYPVDGQGQYI